MRRYVPILIAGIALIVAGCSDTTSPANPVALKRVGDQSYSVRGDGRPAESDAISTTFIIKAAGNQVRLGEFTLTFDPGAVCALTSGYGEAYWNQDCRPHGRDLRMTAKIFTSNNKSYVEFYPDIRFDPAKNVVVSVMRPEIIHDLSKREMRVYDLWYTKRKGNDRVFVDEAWNDEAMRTQYDSQTGRVWRRIRHFSGYVVHVGNCTNNSTDSSCNSSGGTQ